jgi:nucleoside-diphosphate-sugar epimerase
MAYKTVLVLGANGYIGNATATAFVRAGWITYGLVRSSTSAVGLAADEVLAIVGSIDNRESHAAIQAALPPTLDVIVSTTEDVWNYGQHYENIVSLCRMLSASSVSHGGPKPLVIYTRGNKDYGIPGHFADAPDLQPQTEETPLKPLSFLEKSVFHSMRIFDNTDAFDAVLVRPTNIFGRSSTLYRVYFDYGAAAAATITDKSTPLVVSSTGPKSILHALHIDDCADGYVAIASHPRRDEVRGQVFNIASERYETAEAVMAALLAEYGFTGGVRWIGPGETPPSPGPQLLPEAAGLGLLLSIPQWTSAEKLRRLTGWRDCRPQFSEAFHTYRLAFEAAETLGDERSRSSKKMLDNLISLVKAQGSVS